MQNQQAFKNIFRKLGNSNLAFSAITMITGLIIFFLILINRIPFPLRPISMTIRSGFTVVFPPLLLILFLALKIKGKIGQITAFSLTLAIFGLSLAGLWASGQSEYYIISGLIPFVDASDYLNEARRILEGLLITDFSSWRPLFPAFLAPIIALSNHNLQIIQGALVAMTAISCYFLSREIQRTHGTAPAAFVLTILFLYYRRFAGAIVPENFGVILSTLGFTLLWRSISFKSRNELWLGTLSLSLGMFSRMGPFFILLGIIIWSGWFFKHKEEKYSWRILLFTSTAIITAFLIYLSATVLFSGKLQTPLSYFSSKVFYDLTAGYPIKGGQVFIDHPDVLEIDEPQRTIEIFHLAFENIKNAPNNLLQGAVKQWKLFFVHSWYAVYGFLIGGTPIFTYSVYIGMYILCLLCLGTWIKKITDPYFFIIGITTFFAILSVPFVPPSYHNRIRMYAASIPIFAILPALGIHTLSKIFKINFLIQKPSNNHKDNHSLYYSIIIISFLIIGSVSAKVFGSNTQVSEITCDENQVAVYVRIPAGSKVNIIKEDVFEIDWLPNYHRSQFTSYLHSMAHYEAIEELEKIPPPATIFNALDVKTGKDLVGIVPTYLLPDEPGFYGICGNWNTKPEVEEHHLFFGNLVQPISTK